MQCSPHVDPNESVFPRLCLLGKRIASSKFCLGRTCISITIKLRNSVVNFGVTIILFVVTNLA